jgi:hypothetical protein
MNNYRHHVSGFFANRRDANGALGKLVALGLPRGQLRLLETESGTSAKEVRAGSDEVLKDIVVDGAIGTAVGTGIGALAQLALVAANVSLFIASPLIAPLAMLGWGASLGGFIGAAAGAGTKEGGFVALISDAITSGQVVLVAETLTVQETEIAREIIQAAVGDFKDKDHLLGSTETSSRPLSTTSRY